MKFKILNALIVVSILTYGLTRFIEGDKALSAAIKEYPALQYEDSLNAIIINTYHLENSRDIDSFTRIQFSDESKFSISAKNTIMGGVVLRDVSGTGSRVFKKKNSDTLLISHSSVDYTFVLIDL